MRRAKIVKVAVESGVRVILYVARKFTDRDASPKFPQSKLISTHIHKLRRARNQRRTDYNTNTFAHRSVFPATGPASMAVLCWKPDE